MNRREVIYVLAATPLAMQPKSSIRNRITGTWQLVSWEATMKSTGATEYPCGKHPVGRLIYDSAGRMSAQIMNPDRRKVGENFGTRTWAEGLQPEEMREVLNGCYSYFGTFDVDEKRSIVIHHVEAELRPNLVGRERQRNYSFTGKNGITLTYATDRDNDALVWQRAS